MKRTFAVARREFANYFDTPVAYIFLVIFLILCVWWFFWQIKFFVYEQATLLGFFNFLPLVFIPFFPAISMRLWAEERRSGTEELLLTLPLRPMELILGKYLAAFALLILALIGTLPLAITVAFLGPLDWGTVLSGYFGAFFLGGSCLALGLFVSSLTRNQIVAFIVTTALLFSLFMLGTDATIAALPPKMVPWVEYLSLGSHYQSMMRGVIDLRSLFFYLSFIGFFLYLNQVVLMWRKRL